MGETTEPVLGGQKMKKLLKMILGTIVISALCMGQIVYAEEIAEPVEAGVQPLTIQMPFYDDVGSGDWYYSSVNDITRYGLMSGYGNERFGPADNLARAQFAIILHRMNGLQSVPYTDEFSDVPNGQWYTNAIMWASSVGVVEGYANSSLFGTGDNINREQMAVMMYRYAKYKNYDLNKKVDISKFKDGKMVSDFAKEGMQWAVGTGIITGKDNGTRLDPQANANRAESATIINRFLNKYFPSYKYEYTPERGDYGVLTMQGQQFIYSYTVTVSSSSTGYVDVRVERMGRNNSPIYDTDTIRNVPLVGNKAIFSWSDSWENEGEGRITFNKGSLTLTMRLTYQAPHNRATLACEAYELPFMHK